jgi:lipopolysaccharide transport system ATP-binding protein
VSSAGNWLDRQPLLRSPSGEARATVRFPSLPLLKGRYTLSVYVLCDRSINVYAAGEHFATVDVVQDDTHQGLVTLPHVWTMEAGS